MCNDYEQHVAWREYRAKMEGLGLTVSGRNSEADLPRADDIRIGDEGPVARLAGDAVELSPLQFGFPPKGRGGPVFNFRSEGRHFGESKRCLVVASAFFEFTGTRYPKAKHRFALAGEPITAIAALWREGEGNQPPSFAMLTTAPGPDVAPIHDRQVVVLRPEHWLDWLTLRRPETELLRPTPAGALTVEEVRAEAEAKQARRK